MKFRKWNTELITDIIYIRQFYIYFSIYLLTFMALLFHIYDIEEKKRNTTIDIPQEDG
jgi:hypothetical protein